MQLSPIGAVIAGLALASCTPAKPAPASPDVIEILPNGSPTPTPNQTQTDQATPGQDEALERFEARLTIDSKPGGKKLQGVWLERDDGERWVAAYRPLPWFEGFDGHRVKVAGKRYEPTGQAISAQHFTIHTLEISGDPKADPMPSVLRLGAETKLRGHLELRTVPNGAKREGEQYLVFETEAGTSYHVPHSVAAEQIGPTIDVVGREYEPSPYWAAMMGGRHLWVLDVLRP